MDYLAEMGREISTIIKANLNHVDNNHKPLLPEQIEEIESLHEILKERYQLTVDLFKDVDDSVLKELNEHLPNFIAATRQVRKNQIKRIKKREVGTRNSVLFLSILGHFRNLELFANRIVKVFDDLVLNPVEDSEFVPSAIKKELKEMKKEAKLLATADVSDEALDEEDFPGSEEVAQDGKDRDEKTRSGVEANTDLTDPEDGQNGKEDQK